MADKKISQLTDGNIVNETIFPIVTNGVTYKTNFLNIVEKLKDTFLNKNTSVSSTQSGIVNNTSLQELGGVDKKINSVRIGRGNGNDINSVSLGADTLTAENTGTDNTAVGGNSLKELSNGSYNTAIGSSSLEKATNNLYSTAVGAFALYENTNDSNTGIGYAALASNINGKENTSIGSGSNYYTLGSQNTSIGANAGSSMAGTAGVANGNFNISVGFQAGRDLTSGSNNILIENITNASVTSGSFNIIIDPRNKAGINTGSNNVLIGGWNGAFSPNTSNTIALGTGDGVTRFLSTPNGTTLPEQTISLISTSSGKAVVTKEFIPIGISDNIATYNGTTSLTLINLNTNYPTANIGFKVHALSISGSPKIYEKTSLGWVEYNCTIVS